MTFSAKYKTSKAIAAAISANAKAHAEVDAEWHAIGLSVMAHMAEHRDVSVVNNLVIPMYMGLGKGARHAAMTEWLLTFLPVVANTDQATKGTLPFVFSKDKAKIEPDFAMASEKPWYSMQKSPAPDQVFDLNKVVAGLFKKMTEAAAGGKLIVADHEKVKALALAWGLSENDVPEAGMFAKSLAQAKAMKAEADKPAAEVPPVVETAAT